MSQTKYHMRRMAQLERELTATRDKLAKCEKTLARIAAIAHMGGLSDHPVTTLMTAIRCLSLDWWDKSGTVANQKMRVNSAITVAWCLRIANTETASTQNQEI